jgi:hypothetical protein
MTESRSVNRTGTESRSVRIGVKGMLEKEELNPGKGLNLLRMLPTFWAALPLPLFPTSSPLYSTS